MIKKNITRFCVAFIFTITILTQTVVAQSSENSKFGIFGAYATEYSWFQDQMSFSDTDYWNWVDNHFQNLGAHWTRSNAQLAWDLIEPTLGSGYNWNNIMKTDSVIANVYDSPADANWLACIQVLDKSVRDIFSYPTEWQNFLQTAVERYNGDGTNDLNSFVNVKCWQIGNEIMKISSSYTPTEYAQIVVLSESAIHSVDPLAKICLVAPTQALFTDPFLINTIIELSNLGVPFDILDLHHWENSTDYKMSSLPIYRNVLNDNGYTNVEIWSGENGTHCYLPNNVPYQTKIEQASSLLKRYVWNLNNGLDKLFWNNLMEWHGFAGSPVIIFNSMGLIGDGSYCGEPADEFNYLRKSYYSYKMLAENIDADKAIFINNNSFHNELAGNYGYIYQDLSTSDNFEIFWTDNSSATYAITLASDCELTNMVPSDTLGNFATQTFSAGNHNFTIYKDEVYLLKKIDTSSVTETQNHIQSIFPNPTSGTFTIIYDDKSYENVIIYNSIGQVVYENKIYGNKRIIDLSNQSNGIYFVHLQSKNNENTAVKLMKIK